MGEWFFQTLCLFFLIGTFGKKLAVAYIEIMALEILGALDSRIPDDQIKVDGYDTFEGLDLRASMQGLPVLEMPDEVFLTYRRKAIDYLVQIRLVLAVESLGLVDRRYRTFVQYAADILGGLSYLIFAVDSIAAEADGTGVN